MSAPSRFAPIRPLTLARACAGGGRLWAACEVASCGAEAPLDAGPWLAMGLGDLALNSLERRLRCVCGARCARLEMRPALVTGSTSPFPYIFI